MKKNKLVFFVILILINLGINHLFIFKTTFEQVLTLHIFLFILAFSTNLIRKKLLKTKNNTLSALLGINFFRIITSVVFLLPVILREEKFNNTYIYNFFICYFMYLFFEFKYKKTKQNKECNFLIIFFFGLII